MITDERQKQFMLGFEKDGNNSGIAGKFTISGLQNV